MSSIWQESPICRVLLSVVFTCALGYFFANVEINIEGSQGWAASLPTWRIEQHWLLDIFWGGRPMTGYHAWIFSFVFLMFHFPIFLFTTWSWALEARILACVMLFWIVEDFLWFLLNPAFGLERFAAGGIPWHKHWFWFAPTDYWTFTSASFLLFGYSLRK